LTKESDNDRTISTKPLYNKSVFLIFKKKCKKPNNQSAKL